MINLHMVDILCAVDVCYAIH